MDPLSLYAASLAEPAAADKPAAAPAPASAPNAALDLYAQSVQPAAAPAAAGAPGNVQSFVTQYRPLADRIARNLGVAPEALLGQWGLETGWGKSVIPGTNNLGNIKDLTGKGTTAKDNMTGSVDAYRKYETPDAFGDDFAGLLGRRYKSAMGTGRNAQGYFQALKTGGYAEDPDYVNKGVAASKLAAAAMGTAGGAAAADGGEQFVGAAAKPPLTRTTLEAAKDVGLGAVAGVVQGGEMLASAFGADNAVARGANDAAQALIDMQSPARKQQRENRAAEIKQAETSGNTWDEIVANVGAFTDAPVESTLNALGTSAPTILMSLIPGLGQANAARFIMQGAMGAAQGAGAVKGSIYEAVERKLVETGMSKDDAAKVAAGAQAYDSANGQQIAIGALLGSVAGTSGVEKSLARIAGGEGVAKGVVRRTVGGALAEAPVEGVQGGQERLAANTALQNQGFDVPTWQGVAGQAAGEAAASVVPGGVFGAMTPSKPPMPPELVPVAQKAAEPNSPLSKAAMASNTPELMAQRQADQAAAQQQAQAEAEPANPATRLAELETIASGADKPGGRFFTPEERTEYEQLVEARDGTPGAKPKEADAIGDRAKEIAAAVRESGALEQMRAPDSQVKASDLVRDLATAQSPSTPPAAREQALSRVEYALQWAGIDLAPRAAQPVAETGQKAAPAAQPPAAQVDPVVAAMSNPAVSDADKATLRDAYNTALNARLPEATRQQALDTAREIAGRYMAPPAAGPVGQGPAVTEAIPGSPGTMITEAQRLEQGAEQFEAEGFEVDAQQLRDQADSLREAAATARAGETGMELEAEEGDGIASPANEQTVEQPTSVDLPTARTTPAGEGPAYLRRRRASLQQLAGQGFTQVARQEGAFVMRNPTTGQVFNLEGQADSQLARKAIADYVTAAAAQTNTDPTEGQKHAGNYKKGRVNFEGLNIAIENPVGSERKGKDDNGEEWRTPMELAHYGYVVGSESADGDGSDIYLVNSPRVGAKAYVIDQYNEDGSFDETKTVLGAASEAEALRVYDAGFSDGSGPDRRGALTTMTVDEFKAWTKSPAAKKAAGAAPDPAPGAEVEGSMKVKLSADESVDVDLVKSLPDVESVARGGRATRISKKQGAILEAVAAAFGKKVQFYTGTDSGRVGDGFILPGNQGTIFLNATSGRSPIVVFGHELMHQLKRDNPEAHAAIEAVVAKRMNREAVAKTYGDLGYSDGQVMEELVSDLGGDLLADKAFWSDVMDEVRTANGDGAAKKILAQLAEFVYRAIDALSRNLRSYAQTGAGAKLVDDMTEIRAAFQSALAGYMQTHGVAKPAMQAEILRAGQDAKRSAARPAADRATDGLTVEGYHYSQQPRKVLVSSAYGTGLQGSDRAAIQAFPDERVRNRISFYVDKGTGITPESGVGGYAHRATLENVYDSNADLQRLKQGRGKREFEAAVLDAGYDGYLDRMEGTQPGQVIMLGRRGITVEQLGPKGIITNGKKVPAAKARELDFAETIAANNALPTGEPTLQRWGEILQRAMPEAYDRLADTGLFEGQERVFKDELVSRVRALTAPVIASRLRDDPMEVSSRAPWGKTAAEDAVTDMLVVGLDSSRAGEKAFEKNVALVREYPNYRPAKSANTTERQADRFIEATKDNLLWLYDQVPQDIRDRSHLWYDGANKIAKTWAPKYDLKPAQIAGVMAVLSPQKDWFMNVDLARRVIDTMDSQGGQRWGNEMTATAERIFGKPQYADDVKAITGKTLDEVDDLVLKAMWIRAYDETFNDRAHALLSPEGDAMGKVLTQKGEPAKVAWGDLGSISKAVAIIQDGTLANISARLGGEHKVRNFYNNILVPNGSNGHVTIDTHAVAAALLRPLSGSALEVLHNFGGAGAASSAIHGSSGTYGLYAEAYRRAAAERGVLPREMQSITWEAVRGLFTPGFKSQQKNVDETNAIWENYRKGRLSLENARQQILDAAGGIDQPSWFGSGAGSPAQEGRGDTGVVPGVQLPGRGAEPAAGGAGGPAAGAAAGTAARGTDASAVRDAGPVRRSPERVAVEGGQTEGPRGRQEDGSLIGLPRDFTVAGSKITASAWAPAEEVARRYAESAGIKYRPPARYAKVDPERAKRIAKAYDRLKHDPQDPDVQLAYQALAKETAAQYQAVIDSGLQVEFIDYATQGDPYAASPRLMTEDVRNNNHMFVFSTRDGFGSDAEFDPIDNPLLAETEFTISGRKALVNDLFRVVHDYFGHVKEGVGFRADGEENTWRAHSAMFSPLAQRALTTETRGQNSWVNYGPHGDTNRTAGAGDTHYADQKVGLLPRWASEEGRYDEVSADHQQRVDALEELVACLSK